MQYHVPPIMRLRHTIFTFLTVVGLCLSGASDVNAQVAPDQGTWLIGPTGTTTVLSPLAYDRPGAFAYFGLVKDPNVSSVVNTDKCIGGPSFASGLDGAVSTIDASDYFGGKSVFTQMGLGYSGGGGANCTTAGTYYAVFTASVPVSGLYVPFLIFELYYDGVTATPQNPGVVDVEGNDILFSTQYNTRFTDITFGNSTSSVDFDISYFIDPTEATTTQTDKNPTGLRVGYQKIGTSSSPLAYEYIEITDATSTVWGNGTSTFDRILEPDSVYTFVITFANSQTFFSGFVPFPLANVYFDIETDSLGGVATSSAIDFMNALQPQAWDLQPCGLSDIGGCIINAFALLFKPSSASIQQFASLSTDLGTRAPFVYVAQAPVLFQSMFSTTQNQSLTVGATTSIGYISFISKAQLEAIPLSSTVRTIIGYLLWVLLLLHLYYRATNIFNHQEKTV